MPRSSDIPTSPIAPLLEKLSVLHMRTCVEPLWAKCPKWQEGPWDSIRLFLLGYAFEHQGTAQDFGPAAADAVAELRERILGLPAAEEAWNAFAKKLGDRLNHAVNPLCPSRTSYTRKGAARHTKKPSVVELAAETLAGQSLVAWARDQIKEGATRRAHGNLCGINGIGRKIASPFLRDVAVSLDLSARDNDSRSLIQPIDVWVRLVARALSGQPKPDDADCAEYLAQSFSRSERLNQGIWYFCTKVADSSRYVVTRLLADESAFRFRVRQHVRGLQRGPEIAKEFENACSSPQKQA